MPDYGPICVGRYLCHYREDLLTSAEQVARQTLVLSGMLEGAQNEGIRRWLRDKFPEQSEEVMALLQNGPEAFYGRVSTRALAEHGESWMNLCPHCRALCRTPSALQCPRCFDRWD